MIERVQQTEPPRDRLLSNLSSFLGVDDPLGLLGPIFEEIKSGEAALLPSEVVDLIMQGDELGAIGLLVGQGRNGPVPNRRSLRTRRIRKEVDAALMPGGGSVLIGDEPQTLNLGSVSHRIREKITGANGSPLASRRFRVEPVSNKEGLVVEVVFNKKVGITRPLSFFKEEEVLNEPREIFKFSTPMPPLSAGQSIASWLKGIIYNTREVLKEVGLPSKPHDVDRLLANDDTRESLLQMLEAMHILFADQLFTDTPSGMNLTLSKFNTERNEITYAIGNGEVNEFAILNWFSIAGAVIGGESARSRDRGKAFEIPVGNLQILHRDEEGKKITINIKGGKPDLILFDLESEQVQLELGLEAGEKEEGERGEGRRLAECLSVRDVLNEVRAMATSQRRENNRRVIREGQEVVVQRMMGRNLRSYFMCLWKLYGDRIFSDLKIRVVDYKFPAGDGGWFSVLDPNSLPSPRHEVQAQEYLFQVVAQLCWVKKWADCQRAEVGLPGFGVCKGKGVGLKEDESLPEAFEDSERFSITLGEVVAFAKEYNLRGRFDALLSYQLSALEKNIYIGIDFFADRIKEWGEDFINNRIATIKSAEIMRIAKAVRRLTTHREVSLVRKMVKVLPVEISDICHDQKGRFSLVIADLGRMIFYLGESDPQRLVINRAVFLKDRGAYVLWMQRNGSSNLLRLAVTKKGRFAITGLEEGLVRGSLLRCREWWGVDRSDDLITELQQLVWDPLIEAGVGEEREAWYQEDSYIDRDGRDVDLISGKPIVCDQDPLTGAWRLDLKRLSEAIEGLITRDMYHLIKTANTVTGGQTKNIMCPLPGHSNTSTEAATFNADSGYIYCHSCHETIMVSGRKGRRRTDFLPRARGFEVRDTRPVSRGRESAIKALLDVGQEVVLHDSAAHDYLNSRGIGLEGCGPIAYMPFSLAESLADLVLHSAFGRIKGVKGRSLRLDQINSLCLPNFLELEEIKTLVSKVRESVFPYPPEVWQKVLQRFTVATLRNMRARGLIGRSKAKHVLSGGRVLFPTYWFNAGRRGRKIVVSSYYGRGMRLNGRDLFKGPPHMKPFNPQKAAKIQMREIGGERQEVVLGKTPLGFWKKDPREELRFRETGTVIFFETAINALSFARMSPRWADNCVAMSGTGYKQMIAYLRHLGVKRDPNPSEGGLNLELKEVVLGYDYDLGGRRSFERNKKAIEAAFSGLKVTTIDEFVPAEVKAVLPSSKPQDYKEDGDYYECKRDMNDILLQPGIKEKYAYDMQEKTIPF